MTSAYSRGVNYASPLFPLIDGVPDLKHTPDMIKRGDNPRSQKAIGQRIRWTRMALGLTVAAFAKRCGITAQAVANYESGERRPIIDEAWKIADSIGVNILWIYQADMRDIRQDLAEKIMRAAEAEPTRIARTRAGRPKTIR